MIEKLDLQRHYPEHYLALKINELIDAYNFHYHETQNTHYNTTFPKHDDLAQAAAEIEKGE